MMNSKQLTEERGKTHGSFATNAIISQGIKDFMRMQSGWHRLTFVQREALDVQALKISRILSGQSFFADHWADIGGYAELALQEIHNIQETAHGHAADAASSHNLVGDQGGQDRRRSKEGTGARNVQKTSRVRSR